MDGNTIVTVTGGTIGTAGKGGATWGNVYGGGKGKEDDVDAGLVKGNTTINISQAENQTTTIIHNVYGGGAFGSVGTFTYDDTTGLPDGLTANTGTANITITGGTFGSDGKENGMIFGSSRGSEGDPAAEDTNIDKIAWVGNTNVIIGTQSGTPDLTNPKIAGSVYGGGENGHNYQNAQVTIHSGTIGITNPETDGGARYPYRGNVYGGKETTKRPTTTSTPVSYWAIPRLISTVVISCTTFMAVVLWVLWVHIPLLMIHITLHTLMCLSVCLTNVKQVQVIVPSTSRAVYLH